MLDSLASYNVTWDSPSTGPAGSMPTGNGDMGLNVWAEPSGDILLLLGKTDAWDENSINLKIARLRISFSPNPLSLPGAVFKQVLDLLSSDIELTLGPAESPLSVRIWADANHPVVHIEADAGEPVEMRAAVEMWRTEPRAIKTQTGDLFRNLTGPDPYPTIVTPDHVLPARAGGPGEAGRITWCHHNGPRDPDPVAVNLKLQGLGAHLEQSRHPLAGRTTGAAVVGRGFVAGEGAQTLRSAGKSRSHRVSVHALTLQPATVEQWAEALDQQIAAAESLGPSAARREHLRWWREFWERSWIRVTAAPDAPPGEEEKTFQLTRAYLLQRFMNACAGRGAQPIKYNGSIFTVGKPEDPDFRRWGGPGFWFQNQRLIYWPMLAAGDFDLLMPFFRMYREQLPLQRLRTATYYGHGGAHYPETITFWGAEVSAHYGWTPFEKRQRPEAECSYVTYYWTGGIELSLMLVTAYQYTLDEGFAREFVLPIADAVTEFFDFHYPRDERGKIRFEPAGSLETWHEASNPLPEIAGLRYLLPKLLDLPAELTTEGQRARWRRMIGELPDLPVGEKGGRRVLLPAERFDRKKNTENPELYAVFPFRLFGVGKPELELARATFAARLHPAAECWSQDDIQMAYLGMAEEARGHLVARSSPAAHSDSRFPGFWNAFHDWIPDMDHGGVLQMALQAMLLQGEGSELRLLPAWPREWEAEFRLHAAGRTVVEGKVRGGRVTELTVTPEGRRADVRGDVRREVRGGRTGS